MDRLSEWMGSSRETRADLLRLDFNEDQNSNIIMNVKVVESKFRDTFDSEKAEKQTRTSMEFFDLIRECEAEEMKLLINLFIRALREASVPRGNAEDAMIFGEGVDRKG